MCSHSLGKDGERKDDRVTERREVEVVVQRVIRGGGLRQGESHGGRAQKHQTCNDALL